MVYKGRLYTDILMGCSEPIQGVRRRYLNENLGSEDYLKLYYRRITELIIIVLKQKTFNFLPVCHYSRLKLSHDKILFLSFNVVGAPHS